MGVEHGSNVMDIKWSPHDAHLLAVACENGNVYLWRIAEGGLTATRRTPDFAMHGGSTTRR